VPPFSYQDLAKQHVEGRQSIMQQQHENLEDYLQWRGWGVEGTLDEHKLGDDLVNSAVGLLSHPLTFPLTLGRHVKAFSPSQSNVDGQQSEKRHLRLCCVGARAECTLPDDFWREFIVSAMSNLAQNDSEELEQPFQFTIDFVGPDVASHLESKTISLFDNDEHPKQQLTMNYHTSFLHEVVLKFLKSSHATNESNSDGQAASSNRTEQIRQFWDGFALFNPGLGHPNLAKQWKPTLKFLVGTGKPILFTAHSALDADRDRAVLEGLLVDSSDGDSRGDGVEYNINPYASRMGFMDPFHSQGDDDNIHIVRPNYSDFLLR